VGCPNELFCSGRRIRPEKVHEVIGESPLRDLQHVMPSQRSRSDPSDPPENSERATMMEYETQHDVSPSTSDYGSFRTPETGINYVSSSHWAAVLDSITDLRDHISRDEEAHSRVSDPVRPTCKLPQIPIALQLYNVWDLCLDFEVSATSFYCEQIGCSLI
jgi:hypothetical protein